MPATVMRSVSCTLTIINKETVLNIEVMCDSFSIMWSMLMEIMRIEESLIYNFCLSYDMNYVFKGK